LGFPEGPRWRDGKLWFSDFRLKQVMTVDLEGRLTVVTEVAAQPSGLGWLPDQSLLVVSMTDRRLLRLVDGALIEHADLSGLASYHCNDMVVDARGRAYVGNFGSPLFQGPYCTGEIILVSPEGKASVVEEDMAFPNGSVILPDGETLVVAETLAARLTAFTILPDGTLADRRVWAQFDKLGLVPDYHKRPDRVAPDGICLDAEGGIWVASPNADKTLLRVCQGGRITHRFNLKRTPFACMLGGPDRKTLFVLTSKLQTDGRHGCIETLPVDVPGAGLP